MVRAHVAAKDKNLKLIVGAELTLAPDPRSCESSHTLPNRLVVLATNRTGYGNPRR